MDDILALCRDLPVRSFEPGDVLLAQGTQSGLIFVLIEGTVTIEVEDVVLKHVSEPGEFLGEISALLKIPHTAAVVAQTPGRAHVIEAAGVTGNPDFLLGVARLLAARLHAMTSYLIDLRHQYGDQMGQLGLMDQVLSELTSARPVRIAPGSARDDVPDY